MDDAAMEMTPKLPGNFGFWSCTCLREVLLESDGYGNHQYYVAVPFMDTVAN